MLLRRCLLLSCALLVFATAGCSHPNRQRHPDDFVLDVELSRSWARQHATLDSSHTEHHHHVHINVEKDVKDLEDLLVLSLQVVFAAVISDAIDEAVLYAPKTKFVVWTGLKGGKSSYRQRLYWGENKVYFPPETDPRQARLILQVSGDRDLTTSYTLDLTQVNKLLMK